MVPKVSVIVPIYNCEKYISKCLESILKQSYINIEIIIINDGSTDESEKIINKYKDKDDRILYYNQENRGPSATRNVGIEISKGCYIVFVDSDDTLEENYIESLITTAINLECDIATCGYKDVSKYGLIQLNDFWNGKSLVEKNEFITNIFKGLGGTLWGKIFKRDIIIKQNIRMSPDIFLCEDMVFVLEYTMHCNKYGSIKESLYNYNRLNENSISTKVNISSYNNLIVVIRKIEEILTLYSFETDYVDSILSKRIQSLLTSFIIMQHAKQFNYSNKDKINNLEILFKSDYFKRYKNSLSSKLLKEKLLILLIKKNKKEFLNYYSFLLYSIQYIKDIIRTKMLTDNINKNKLLFEEERY